MNEWVNHATAKRAELTPQQRRDAVITALRQAIEASNDRSGRRYWVKWPYPAFSDSGHNLSMRCPLIEDKMPSGLGGWFKFAGEFFLRLAILFGAVTGGYTVHQIGCQGKTAPQPPGTSTIPSKPAPVDPPPIADKPANDAIDAICRIQFGKYGCSATLTWPPLPDGRIQLVTAAHCLKGQPTTGVAVLRDGRTFRVVVQGSWDGPDVAWLITELPVKDFPTAKLAAKNPMPGDQVWHAGYGVNVPGNRVNGTVTSATSTAGQTEYLIEVSSGDSGGGIALNSNGEVLSPVCCTTDPGQRARVWGCSPEVAAKYRPLPKPVMDEWTPIPIPVVMPDR